MKGERFESRPFITDGILLAIASGAIYWITMSYEVAFLGAFGIPPDFAEVRLETILIMFLAFSGIGWLFFSTANLLAMFWPKHPTLQEKILRIVFILLYPIWNLVNFGLRQKDMAYYLLVIILLVVFELLWPMLVFHDKGSLIKRFIADEDSETPARRRTLFGRLAALTGPFAYSIIIMGVFGSGLAQTAARAKAEKQSEYLVIIDQPPIAMVRLYSDRIIGVRFDEQTKRLDGKFVLIPKDSKSNLELILKKVGPLLAQESKH